LQRLLFSKGFLHAGIQRMGGAKIRNKVVKTRVYNDALKKPDKYLFGTLKLMRIFFALSTFYLACIYAIDFKRMKPKKVITSLLFVFVVTFSGFAQDADSDTDEEGAEIIRRYALCVFPTNATHVNGLCVALSHNHKRLINGVNIDFPGARFTEYLIFRMSRDIYPERFASINGLTISFNPIYNKVNGVGIFAFTTEIYTFNGLMIGTLNGVKEMNGLQLGLFNTAADGRFIQIGLLNTISGNPRGLRTFPGINMRFKKKAIKQMDTE
jgi:hypothetical protein